METLRHSWRSALYWGIGLAALALVVMLTIQDADALQQYQQLTQTLPPALLQILGGGDLALLATPEGFLGLGFFGRALLILIVYAVLVGLGVTANEEEQGILDMVLSLPIPRWQLVLEKFLATALLLAVVIAITTLGLLSGIPLTALELNTGNLVWGMVNLFPGTLVSIAVTVCMTAIFRRRSIAIVVTMLIVLCSYLLFALGQTATGTIFNTLSWISFFRYYDYTDLLLNGFSWGYAVLLIGVSVVLVSIGMWHFQQRDVGN
jgi:ABC-type transport system involved in multi-copper enzyme maturation permease subunit